MIGRKELVHFLLIIIGCACFVFFGRLMVCYFFPNEFPECHEFLFSEGFVSGTNLAVQELKESMEATPFFDEVEIHLWEIKDFPILHGCLCQHRYDHRPVISKEEQAFIDNLKDHLKVNRSWLH
jgi:hypothetical protein